MVAVIVVVPAFDKVVTFPFSETLATSSSLLDHSISLPLGVTVATNVIDLLVPNSNEVLSKDIVLVTGLSLGLGLGEGSSLGELSPLSLD